MIEALRSWLLGLISVSLACAVASALMPPGAAKQAGRLVCGLAVMLAILSPLVRGEAAADRGWTEELFAQTRQRREELDRQVNGQLKSIIEQRCAAYIVDKAALLGLGCTARVECRETEDGIFLPVRAVIAGQLSQEDLARLETVIAQDLDLEQIVMEEEVP